MLSPGFRSAGFLVELDVTVFEQPFRLGRHLVQVWDYVSHDRAHLVVMLT